jgi:hypothetical protein
MTDCQESPLLCPLCKMECVKNLDMFMCPTKITMVNEMEYHHYSWEHNGDYPLERLYFPPNFFMKNLEGKSKIYKMSFTKDPYSLYTRLVVTIPQLHYDTPENMLERIKKLVIFS